MDIIKSNKVVDLRFVKPGEFKQPVHEKVAWTKENAKELSRRPTENPVWPKPNPSAPLMEYGKRNLYYLNKHGKQFVIPESKAWALHDRMGEFHGDQNGNMTPPRDPGDYIRFGIDERWVHKSQLKKQ